MGLSLRSFLPTRVAKPLLEGQQRVFVDHAHIDTSAAIGERRRSCLVDAGCETCYLEMHSKSSSAEDGCDRCLVLNIDQGSVGFPAAVYLFTECGLRGCWFGDPWHRQWNDLKGSLKSTGLGFGSPS